MRIKRICIFLFSLFLTFTLTVVPVHAEDTSPSIDPSSLLSDYAYITDSESGQVLLDKNGEEKIYPASLTKMMTVIVAMENLTDRTETVTITDQMLDGLYEAQASVAGFKAGDQPTVEDLFYCSALPSGADASIALAYTAAGSIDSYVDLMNEEAKKIGMKHTHFANVTGLHDPNHYSTAEDLNKLLQYCLRNDEFVRVFSTQRYTTHPLASAPQGLLVYSTTAIYEANSGYSLPGLIGSKTGYTEEAERCLAYWAEVNGMKVTAITAHAVQNQDHLWPHIEDAQTVLQTLTNWGKRQIVQKNDILKTIKIHHMFSDDTTENITAPADVALDMPDSDQPSVFVDMPDETDSSYTGTTLSGTIQVQLNGTAVSSTDVSVPVAADPNFFARLLKRIRSWF